MTDSANGPCLISRIWCACECLDLPVMTAGAAALYWHKFVSYHQYTLKKDHVTFGVPAIIYLACKATEQSVLIRDIFNICKALELNHVDVKALDEEYTENKKKIILLEHEAIRILAFKFEADLPHPYLLNFARILQLPSSPVQIALRIVNSSFPDERIVRAAPHIVAVAALYCGIKFDLLQFGTEPLVEQYWWRKFGVVDKDIFETIVWLPNVQAACISVEESTY